MTVHELDPEGDTILILRNPGSPFAIWYEDCEARVSSHQEQSETKSGEPAPAGEPPNEVTNKVDDSNLPKASSEKDVTFRLSSRHLILASKYFKSVLQGPWKEATEIHPDNCRHIEARDWDENAMLILMQVIHGLNRKVPRSVTLEMLAKIAVLVDYYKCHEAVALWSDVWIGNLKDTVPTTINRDLVLWILVAYVFEKETLFKEATKVAVPQCRRYLPTLDLPIVAVADKIEVKRLGILHQIFTHIYGILELLRGGEVGCRFECSAMMLGALTMKMHAEGILDPRQEPPYFGYSITSAMNMVRKFESPSWAIPGSLYISPQNHSLRKMIDNNVIIGSESAHGCKLSVFFDLKIADTVEGLELREI
ncbi:hypothetical protein M434DRAFT_400814 [Hypoxylon sp. CO27-5]|nr:hypothetical protein M434DRAFT_400814 [Hypoxylon sp. CO27-5]